MNLKTSTDLGKGREPALGHHMGGEITLTSTGGVSFPKDLLVVLERGYCSSQKCIGSLKGTPHSEAAVQRDELR